MGSRIYPSDFFYVVVSIGAYFAWTSSMMITSTFFPDATLADPKLNWMLNLAGHALALACLSALAPRLAPLGTKRRLGTAVAVVMALCTIALALGPSLPEGGGLVGAASLISGLASGVLLFYWADALVSLQTIELQHLVIQAGVIAGPLATIVIMCLPGAFGVIVCMGLPFVLVASACHVCGRMPREAQAPANESTGKAASFSRDKDGSRDEAPVQSPAAPPHSLRTVALLLLCCFVLALPAGMHQDIEAVRGGAPSVDSWRTILACICVFVAIAVFIDRWLSHKSPSRLFSRLIVPLMAGGLLIISVLGPEFEEWGEYVMEAGYQLFLIYIYTEFARTADLRLMAPLRVFGVGTLVIDLGLFAGFFLLSGTSYLKADWIQATLLGAVYLLLLVGILIFPSVMEQVNLKAKRRVTLTMEGAPVALEEALRDEGASADGRNPSALHDFAKAAGLSSREEEILQQLVTGRTLPSIAAETHLSYNTVKTHVSHIYQKANVHTRDELLDALDASQIEDASE